jgi:hypothetical protein
MTRMIDPQKLKNERRTQAGVFGGTMTPLGPCCNNDQHDV